MSQVLYNYTSLKHREKAVYNLFNAVKFEQGISYTKIAIISASEFCSLLLGQLFSYVPTLFNKPAINMLMFLGDDFNLKYLVTWLVIGGGVAAIMLNVEIGSFKIYEYLAAYLRPKYIYNINSNKKYLGKLTFTNTAIKSLFRKVL